MAPKTEKKPTEKKPAEEKMSAMAEKKPKADKKLPKEGGAAVGEKKKKKSTKTYKIFIFKVLKQIYLDIEISSKIKRMMNNFTHLLHDGYDSS